MTAHIVPNRPPPSEVDRALEGSARNEFLREILLLVEQLVSDQNLHRIRCAELTPRGARVIRTENLTLTYEPYQPPRAEIFQVERTLDNGNIRRSEIEISGGEVQARKARRIGSPDALIDEPENGIPTLDLLEFLNELQHVPGLGRELTSLVQAITSREKGKTRAEKSLPVLVRFVQRMAHRAIEEAIAGRESRQEAERLRHRVRNAEHTAENSQTALVNARIVNAMSIIAALAVAAVAINVPEIGRATGDWISASIRPEEDLSRSPMDRFIAALERNRVPGSFTPINKDNTLPHGANAVPKGIRHFEGPKDRSGEERVGILKYGRRSGFNWEGNSLPASFADFNPALNDRVILESDDGSTYTYNFKPDRIETNRYSVDSYKDELIYVILEGDPVMYYHVAKNGTIGEGFHRDLYAILASGITADKSTNIQIISKRSWDRGGKQDAISLNTFLHSLSHAR